MKRTLCAIGVLVKTNSAPGKKHEEAEAEPAEEGVTDAEVRRAQQCRAKQRIEVRVVRSRDGTYDFARNLGEYVASVSWKKFRTR